MKELIKQNIERSGRHLYSIFPGETPQYLYTIGVWRKVDAEIVLAGCAFFPLPMAADLLNDVAVELESGKEASEISRTVEGVGTFTLRKVHASWSSKLLLGALDYYEVPSIAAWQLVLDDEHATIDQPDMSLPFSPETHPVWRWLEEKWPYKEPPDKPVVTHLAPMRGEAVIEISHWPDGNWEMYSQPSLEVPNEKCFVVPLSTLVSYDKEIEPVLDIPPGLVAVRELEGWNGVWDVCPLGD